jgi:hypothetical protein
MRTDAGNPLPDARAAVTPNHDLLRFEDGVSGQDRKSYSDDQDRESYTVSFEDAVDVDRIGELTEDEVDQALHALRNV